MGKKDMSGPARNGVIVYSHNIKALSDFYIDLFGMAKQRETEDFISIGYTDFNIIIHTPPFELPTERHNTVKVFLTVSSLEASKAKAESLGGEVFEGEWSNPMFKVGNIADPEGNHIQLREFLT